MIINQGTSKKSKNVLKIISFIVAFCLFTPLLLTGCSSENEFGIWPGSSNYRGKATTTGCYSVEIDVVSSIRQWGSLAAEVGGACVVSKSIIENTSDDSHEFQPSTSQLNEFSNADIVITNGLDYDKWAERGINSAKQKNNKLKVINVAELNSVEQTANKHLWENLDYINKTRGQILLSLIQVVTDRTDDSKEDKAQRSDSRINDLNIGDSFSSNRADYVNSILKKTTKNIDNKISAIQKKIKDFKNKYKGKAAICTEPLIAYLLEKLEITDKTPESFYNSIVNESEPNASDISNIENMLSNKNVNIFVVNEQKTLNMIDKLKDAANKSGVYTFTSTEIMPKDFNSIYDWYSTKIDNLIKAFK